MQRLLTERGYTIVDNPGVADLVIAHSGGHLMVDNTDRQFLLIDASYNTGRTELDNVLRHIAYDLWHVLPRQPLFYFWKSTWNLVYFIRDFRRAITMYRRLKTGLYPPSRFHSALVTQSNDHAWYDAKALPQEQVTFIATSHDDCWLHPNVYLDLVPPT